MRVSQQATRRAVLGAFSVAVVLALLPLGVGTYFGGDLSRYEVAMLCAVQRAVAGDTGLWLSPAVGNGSPLFAEVGAQLLYPPRWLALLFPPDVGASMAVVLHLSFAAATCAWLLRTFGLRPLLAAAGGVVFAASGPVFDLVQHSLYIAGAAWLPLVWAGARRALHPRGEARALAMVTGALALLALAGELQALAIGVALLSMEVAARVLPYANRKPRVTTQLSMLRALRTVGAALAGVALVAVQWIPTVLESALSRRAHGFSTSEQFSGAFPPAQLVMALLPLDAERAAEVHLFQALHAAGPSAWTSCCYLGVLLCAAGVAGLGVWRTRVAQLLWCGAGLAALGSATPFLPVLTRVFPPLGDFRYPAKYLVVATLALVVTACVGMARAPRRMRLALLAAALLCSAALLWVLMFVDGPVAPVVGGALAVALVPTAIAWAAVTWGRARSPLRMAAPAVVCVVDLIALGVWPALQVGPPTLSRASLVADALGPDDVLCTDRDIGQVRLQRRGDDPAWALLASAHALALPDLQACDGVVGATPYTALQPALNHELAVAMADNSEGAARALGCSVVLLATSPGEGEAPGLQRLPVAALDRVAESVGAQFAAFRVRDALPPVRVMRSPQRARDEDAILHAAIKGDGRAALSLVDDPFQRLGDGALPDGAGVTGVRVQRDGIAAATVELQGSGGAMVAVRVLFARGWQAQQGGLPLAVVRAAGNQVAVRVEDVTRGPVLLAYRPPGLGFGALLSLPGVVAFVWLLRRATRQSVR